MEQYGLSPTEFKQHGSTEAACAGVEGHQACPITATEIGLREEQILHSRFDSGFFGGQVQGSGGEIESCTTLFARRANAPIHTSVVPNTAGDE